MENVESQSPTSLPKSPPSIKKLWKNLYPGEDYAEMVRACARESYFANNPSKAGEPFTWRMASFADMNAYERTPKWLETKALFDVLKAKHRSELVDFKGKFPLAYARLVVELQRNWCYHVQGPFPDFYLN